MAQMMAHFNELDTREISQLQFGKEHQGQPRARRVVIDVSHLQNKWLEKASENSGHFVNREESDSKFPFVVFFKFEI